MFHPGVFAVLWSVMTCSFGFTMDRSVALVPSTWDTAPSLDTYQRVDTALNDKMQVTGTDRILQTADAKVSANLEGIAENGTREKRATTESTEIKFVNNTAASTMRNDTSNSSEKNTKVNIIPRNVMLLLIDERDQDEKREESLWEHYKNRLPIDRFAIEGFLQRCRSKIETPSISLDGALISENKGKDCDRERILRANIGELVTWARQTRGMTTGVVHNSNFFISPLYPKEFNVSNESDIKSDIHKNKRDLNDIWKIIGDHSNREKSISSLGTADPKTETMNNDGAWNVFDMFSKVGMDIFRSLLESWSRNPSAIEDDFSLHKSFPLKPTVTNLIENTIKSLKSIPNNNGYMLIAIVPRNEGIIAVDLVTREISLKDTLLIVTQIRAGDEESVPFVAQGPNQEILREAATIEQLPIAIRKAIASDCIGSGCTNRYKRDIPIVSHLPIAIFSQLPVRKRFTRDKDAVEQSETNKSTDTNVKDTVSNVETTIIEKKKEASFSSTSSKTMPCGFATMFSVAASVVAAVWASS